jgi:hypothetical protein
MEMDGARYLIVEFYNERNDKSIDTTIMGKKSRRNKGTSGHDAAAASATSAPGTSTTVPPVAVAAATATATAEAVYYYPSDGPSDVEQLQTTSASLQAKLNQLTELGLIQNNCVEFVNQFVPLDLSEADKIAYLQDLTTAEADGQWRNLVAEIAAIRSGKGVDRIEGNQQTRAVFYFRHPLLEQCDREVAFVCVRGEWRADG